MPGKYASTVTPAAAGFRHRARAFAARRQRAVGGHRRRADSGHHRWRREVDQRHAAADQAVDAHLQHGRRPLRYQDGVRRREHAAAGRHESALLAHARRRQDVDRNQQRHRRRRGCEFDSRRSAQEGSALRRHRYAGLGLVRRRRQLAFAAARICPRFRCAISR